MLGVGSPSNENVEVERKSDGEGNFVAIRGNDGRSRQREIWWRDLSGRSCKP